MKMRQISIVYGEGKDWDAIYIDGKLETENIRICPVYLMNIIEKYQCFTPHIEKWYVKDFYLDRVGNYPLCLSDIPKDVFVVE